MPNYINIFSSIYIYVQQYTLCTLNIFFIILLKCPYQLSLILNCICTHSSNVFVHIPQMYLSSFLKCICPHSSKVFSAKHLHSGCAHPAYAVQARVEDYHHDDVDDDVDNDIHNYDDVDNGV